MSLYLSSYFPHFRIAMENGIKRGIYVFGHFRLDTRNLMLYRNQAELSMPPKVIKTLAVLVEGSGKIIAKDELIERVWSDAIVDESNLSQHLYALRKVLGKAPNGGQYIETLRRRGYRFNGNVRFYESDEAMQYMHAKAIHAAPNIRTSANVLRLVDRDPASEPTSKVAAADGQTVVLGKTSAAWKKIIIGLLLLSAVAALGSFVLYRAPFQPQAKARGGELSFLRLTNGIKPVDAAISPNGDYFVYHELSEDGTRLWLQQVGSASRIEIVPISRSLYSGKTFSPDGRYVYFIAYEDAGAEPSLYRVAAMGGPQVKILSGVFAPVSFSPDGSQMAFISGDKQGVTAVVVADSDGLNDRTIVQYAGRDVLVGGPAWSPDGSIIVFAVGDVDGGPGNVGIFSINQAGGPPKRLSDERWDNVYRMVWTYDGRGLAIIGTREGEGYTTRRNQVYYLSYPDGESRRLTTDGSRHEEYSLGVTRDDALIAIPFNRSSQIWSMDRGGDAATAVQITHGLGDGRAGLAPILDGRVGFIARAGDELNIWLMNADGSRIEQLTDGSQGMEELRADSLGRFFLFSAPRQGANHIFRLDLGGKNIRQLTFGDDQDVDSSVSPDGNWIVYQSIKVPGKPALFKIPADGGEPMAFGDGECASPHFSPLGDKLSCIRNENEIVVLSTADGSELKRFAIPPYSTVNSGVRWTPDGIGLAYIRSEKGFSNIWIQRLDGGSPRQLTNFTSAEIYNFAFSTDGTRLFVARGYPINDAVLIRNFR